MTTYRLRAVQLIEQCKDMSYGSAHVATAQEAVRQADLSADLELQLTARDELIAAATFAGRAEVSLAAFAWNLAKLDIERMATRDDLWVQFQWVAEDSALMLAASRDSYAQILDQMDEVYRVSNWWDYPVQIARFRSTEVFGGTRAELAPRFDALVRSAENARKPHGDYLTHVLAAAHFTMGKPARGIQVLAPNFSRGTDSQNEYPTRCHAITTLPNFLLERRIEADHHFRAACRMTATNPVFIREIAPLITHASLNERDVEVVTLIERHLPWALTNFDQWSAMRFFHIAAWALRRLPGVPVALRLPAELPEVSAGGEPFDPRALADALQQRGDALAAAFDERNGNSAWTSRSNRLHAGEAPTVLLTPE